MMERMEVLLNDLSIWGFLIVLKGLEAEWICYIKPSIIFLPCKSSSLVCCSGENTSPIKILKGEKRWEGVKKLNVSFFFLVDRDFCFSFCLCVCAVLPAFFCSTDLSPPQSKGFSVFVCVACMENSSSAFQNRKKREGRIWLSAM